MRAAVRWSLSLAVGVVLLGTLFFFVDMRSLGSTLLHSRWGYVLLAALLNVGVLAAKARRWQVILEGASSPQSFRQIFRATILGFWGNVVLPARAGDIGRGLYVARHQALTKTTGLATVALDKAMDAFSLVAVVAPLAVLGGIPHAFRLGVQLVVATSVVGFVLLFLLARRYGHRDHTQETGRLVQAVVRVANGMRSLTQGRRLAKVYGLAIFSWLLQIAMLVACGLALRVTMSWAEATLVLVGVNVVIFLPGTPGNVGTMHAAVLVTMGLLGFSRTQALGVGLLYHALQVIVLFALALSILHGLGGRTLGRRRPDDQNFSSDDNQDHTDGQTSPPVEGDADSTNFEGRPPETTRGNHEQKE